MQVITAARGQLDRIVRCLLRPTIVVRVIRVHSVNLVAVEFEMLDSVILVKDAEPRLLVVRIRRRAEVKVSDIAEGSRNIEFHALTRLPRAPVSTIHFSCADLEGDAGCLRLPFADANPPASLGCLSVRRRRAYA